MLSGAVSARGPLQLGTGVPATASPAAFRKVGLGAVVWGRGEQQARFCIWSFRPGGGPASWPENHPAAARTKAISWAPPPCSSIRKGGPLYGWKNRGIFTVVVTGWSGLRVCRPVGQLLALRSLVS